jgi:hypothetical protein
MKICSSCKKNKDNSEFNKKLDKLQPYCRTCDNQKARQRYANNREHHIKIIGERNRRIRKEIQEEIKTMKESTPCSDCGKYYPSYVMDFDHVRGIKNNNISKLSNMASRNKLKDELLKCEIVCANCHRERTYGKNPK